MYAAAVMTAGDAMAKKKKRAISQPAASITADQLAGLWFISRISDGMTGCPFSSRADGTGKIADGVSEKVYNWVIKGDTVTCCELDSAGKASAGAAFQWKYNAAGKMFTSMIYDSKPDRGNALKKPE
jgi:hypothetical protein